MNDRAVEIFRTFLTVVGILLLVIFGSRAAAQARNMKLAGATHKSVFAVGTDIMNVLGFGKADPIVTYEPKPINSRVPAQIQTIAPIPTHSASSGSSADTQTANQSSSSENANSDNSGRHKGSDAIGNVTSKTQQVVNNVTKNTSNDFINLWP